MYNAVSIFCRFHRSECDLRETQNAHNRLKATLEQFQRELALMQEKERQLNNRIKLLTSKLKAEKDEVEDCRNLY